LEEEKTNVNTKREILSYWKPNITLNLVDDQSTYGRSSIPPQVENRSFHSFISSFLTSHDNLQRRVAIFARFIRKRILDIERTSYRSK
jgi:hypothetical protein